MDCNLRQGRFFVPLLVELVSAPPTSAPETLNLSGHEEGSLMHKLTFYIHKNASNLTG